MKEPHSKMENNAWHKKQNWVFHKLIFMNSIDYSIEFKIY